MTRARWRMVGWIMGLSLFLTVAAVWASTDRAVFDPTISLGVVLHLVGLIITLGTAVFLAGRFVGHLKEELFTEVRRMHGEITEKMNNVEQRLGVVESRVTDLWDSWKETRGA